MQEVEALCERVIIINKGTIVADDQLSKLQSGKSKQTVQVSFKETLEAAWLERLQGSKTVTRMEGNSWEIETDDAEGLRKQILQMAIEHNLNIVSLQSGSKSLEDVFRSLTA